MRCILLIGGIREKTPFARGAWPTNLWSAGDVDVRDVFYGNGAPSGPNYLLFSDVDRLLEASLGRSGSG